MHDLHAPPYTRYYADIFTDTSLLMQRKKCFHNKMWHSSSIHARVHISETAAGTAMCTNTPLYLHAQEPRATTSLCETLELEEKKPHCIHSSIPKHTLSSPLSLLMSALQFKMVTLLSHMIYNLGIAGSSTRCYHACRELHLWCSLQCVGFHKL